MGVRVNGPSPVTMFTTRLGALTARARLGVVVCDHWLFSGRGDVGRVDCARHWRKSRRKSRLRVGALTAKGRRRRLVASASRRELGMMIGIHRRIRANRWRRNGRVYRGRRRVSRARNVPRASGSIALAIV
jgi:hypothetical protein